MNVLKNSSRYIFNLSIHTQKLSLFSQLCFCFLFAKCREIFSRLEYSSRKWVGWFGNSLHTSVQGFVICFSALPDEILQFRLCSLFSLPIPITESISLSLSHSNNFFANSRNLRLLRNKDKQKRRKTKGMKVNTRGTIQTKPWNPSNITRYNGIYCLPQRGHELFQPAHLYQVIAESYLSFTATNL